jgi:2-oxoisovalerate dehydrogenase E1 component alpha subunit
MLLARCLEERLIRMNKQGDGYFWVGGPGEEALNASLGLLVHKGQGPEFDYLHLHYRSTATLLAMGADPVDTLRQMKNTATDPYSGGRNFCNHYSVRRWNVIPVSSPIEVQFSMAPGTAIANKRAGGRGITIVQGGDAGTAEGDFSTCLVWSSLPKRELPCLMIVANNQWGISTPASDVHAEKHIADRATVFGIKNAVVDGNEAETCYRELKKAMEYVRVERRPFLLEVMVSRLYGHTSASGANFVPEEVDVFAPFEKKLEERRIMTRGEMDELRAKYTQQLLEASKRVREEPQPKGESIHRHVFADRDLVHEPLRPAPPSTPSRGTKNGVH